MIEISNFKITKKEFSTKIEADIDDFNLYFKVPSEYGVQETGDPFVSAAFFPAMLKNKDVLVDDKIPVSGKLIENLPRLQEIFKCWYRDLNYFNVKARLSESFIKNEGVASFFSGGVDGLYSLNKNREKITHLIYINGFDFEMDQVEFEHAISRIQKTSDSYGIKLIPVETNFYSFMKKDLIDRPMNFGSNLASVGQILGFPKTIIAAGNTYNHLYPLGAHPVSDHLWSTEATEFIHDGAEAERTEKTMALIKAADNIIDHLIVCWENPNINCCECTKCLRTMIALEIAGAKSTAFPVPLNIRKLRKLWIGGHGDLSFVRENIRLAIKYKRYDISRELKAAILRYRLRKIRAGILNRFKNE